MNRRQYRWIVWVLGVVVYCSVVTPCVADTLGLTQCVAYAEAHSRELKEALLALDRQELATYISRGRYRTDLSVRGDWNDGSGDGNGRAELSREIPWGMDLSASYRNQFPDEGEDSATLAFGISKVVLGGGSRAASMLEIDNSLLDELIRGNRVHQERRRLAYRVCSAYYSVIRAQQTLLVRQRRLERAERNLAVTRERENPLDIANAELEIPDAQASVVRAEREIASALDRLKLIMGMAVEQPLAIAEVVEFAPRQIGLEADLAYCHGHHEELLNAELERRKLENTLLVQERRGWPEVTVGVTYEEYSGGSDEEEELSATAAMRWELGSRTERARTRRGELDVEAHGIETDSLRESRVALVRDLARRLEETLQSVTLREKGLEVAQLRVALYADLWENGEIDILEYQRSQNNYEDSRIDLINLQTTYMERLSEYTYEVGQ
jgi:outer membrane protein TolC